MIAYFASDLLWATRIKALAQDLGLEARPVRDLAMLEARLADSPFRGLIVDLAHPDPQLALAVIRRARQGPAPSGDAPTGATPTDQPTRSGPVRIVAFGPHVETALLMAAKEAGADAVMTRGAFDARMTEVLPWADTQGEIRADSV